jgi:hypothetical protein
MAASFTIETVADNVSEQASLALDQHGNPRIVFSRLDTGQIIVAARDGGAWTLENVPNAFVGRGNRPRLAIDSKGNPQIAYHDFSSATSGELVHAVKSAGQWSFVHIPTRPIGELHPGPGPVGEFDFALHPGRLDTQSRDVAYFVYGASSPNLIGFAHTGGIGPTLVIVEADADDETSFTGPSVCFDRSEGFFFAYLSIRPQGGPQDLVSVKSRHIQDIEKGTFSDSFDIESSLLINVRNPTSLARSGVAGCLAYFDIASKTLKAGVDESSIHSIETVAANIATRVTPSAAVTPDVALTPDVANEFRVAYADIDAMKLASRSRFGGTWTVEVIEAVRGQSPSLAYDRAAAANIAYTAGGKLKYARREN